MKEVIKLMAEFVNDIHDIFIIILELFGFQFSDKQLHFWIIGMIGIVFFLFVNISFKWVAKWSITSISFVYTFTVLVVLVFAIEIQQKITSRGNMEFQDAVIGLWGFIAFFIFYLCVRFVFYGLRNLLFENRDRENTKEN